jgi:tRNA (guanosine-2'-O-)-methyltransferase
MNDSLLIEYLSQFISERRLALIHQVLNNRTRYFTVLLEDIIQTQNASAVLRTCECYGIQDVHIIENDNRYQYNPGVAMGAGKWIHLNKYNQSENNSYDAILTLKQKGYRIVATVPTENCIKLDDFNVLKGKAAFVFGSEINGISSVIRENADEMITIPMYGFTESYNISVSAAIIISHVIDKLRNSEVNWQLTEPEKNFLLFEWLKLSIKKPELLIQNFNSSSKN